MAAQHNFSDALATWKEINLSELQKTLDVQGLEIVENQKESVVGRKGLADKTKDFRKLPDDEKLDAWKGLLKAYQTEIDNLTRRGKTSENAFLSVYKMLAEAPDPYPLLDIAVDQAVKVAEAQVLQSELARLRDDNADLKRRVAELGTLEAAKKKAEARAEQLEEKMEDMIREKVTQKENELNATYDERLRNYEDREHDLQRQVTLAREQLRDLRVSNESTQAKLMDHSERQDQEVVAKLAEMDMIVSDLERANSRVVAVERRNEILRAEIESLRSGSDTAERVKALQAQISELEGERARVVAALETRKDVSQHAEAEARRREEELQRELNAKDAEIGHLKTRLRRYADYDEVKRELEIMKYVEFAGGDDEGWDADEPNGAVNGVRLPDPKGEKQHGKSLEALLAAKNKRILEELTKFRIMHNELEASLRQVQEELETSRAELEQRTALTEKLENDLLQLNRVPVHTPGETDESEGGLASVIKSDSSSGTRSTPIPFSTSGGADTSILPIVTSQRDRFRARNAELEEELRKQAGLMSELRAEVKALQSDNLKLYEKVRYMQSYRDGPPAQEGASGTLDVLDRAQGTASETADVGKYRARYEESMNPFERFRGHEAQRAVQALNPVERGVLVLTRHVLGNRRARAAFIVYAIALHLLVVFQGYASATSESSAQRKSPHI